MTMLDGELDMTRIRRDLIAALAGTALNDATYADVTVRTGQRTSSPSRTAGEFATRAGIEFGAEEEAENCKRGFVALLGDVTAQEK
jgi:hypothetical protein